jgi:hypothetical protein
MANRVFIKVTFPLLKEVKHVLILEPSDNFFGSASSLSLSNVKVHRRLI